IPLERRLRVLVWAAAAVLFVCPTLAGHALDHDQPAVIAPAADLLHLGGAAVWLGGVASLALARVGTVRRFAAYALPAVAVVALGGAARALTELSSASQIWTTSYGRTLVVKTVLFVVVLGLVWLTHRRFLPLQLALLCGLALAVGVLTDLRPGRARSAVSAAAPAIPVPPAPPPAHAYVGAGTPRARRRRLDDASVRRPRNASPRRRGAAPRAHDLRRRARAHDRRAALLPSRNRADDGVPRARPGPALVPHHLVDRTRPGGAAGDRDRRAPVGSARRRVVAREHDGADPRSERVLGAAPAERVLRGAGRDHVLRPADPRVVPGAARLSRQAGRARDDRCGALHAPRLLVSLAADLAALTVELRLALDEL